jgi:hypothetical protein
MTPALSINLRYPYWYFSSLKGRLGLLCFFVVFWLLGFNKKEFCFPISLLFLGIISAVTLQRQVLSKPFSYCLPGYHDVPRKILAIQGCAFSFFTALFILCFPCNTLWEMLLRILSTFFLFLLLFVWSVFSFSGLLGKWSGICSIAWLLLCGTEFLGIGILKNAILFHPILTLCIGVLPLPLFWHLLDGSAWARTEIGKDIVTTQFGNGRRGYTRFAHFISSRQNMKQSFFWRATQGLALKRMQRSKPKSLSLMFWGNLYESASRRYSSPLLIPCILFLLVFCVGIFNPLDASAQLVSLFLSCISVRLGINSLPFYSPYILSFGRRNYFWYLLARGCAHLMRLFFLVLWIIASLCILNAYMPSLTFLEYPWHPCALPWKVCTLWLAMVPFLLWAQLLDNPCLVRINPQEARGFEKDPKTFWGVILTLLFFAVVAWRIWGTDSFSLIDPWVLAVMASGLALWVATLRYRVRHSDLI